MKSFKRWLNLALMSLTGTALILIPFAPAVSALDSGSTGVTISSILGEENGEYNSLGSEPSPVVAVNSTRVFQLLNNQYYIITRGGSGVQGTAWQITHSPTSYYLTDPQVMWDPLSGRFYYSYIEQDTSHRNGINWGFSKTANPTSAADFCSYFSVFNYGTSSAPDKDSLGDSRNFIFIASERTIPGAGNQLGSDVDYISKPPAGTSCPSSSSFIKGTKSLTSSPATGDENANQPTGYPYYPVVAKQVDENPTTWIVGLPSYTSANYLNVIQVSPGGNGLPVFYPTKNLIVPQYSAEAYGLQGVQGGIVPQSSDQCTVCSQCTPGPNLEVWISLNGMYMAFDPRLGHYALWTSDTIQGDTPTETAVRWYELFPGGNSVDQTGTISSPSLDYFNSAIAPDRAVVYGTGSKYGSDMAITFNSSSSCSYPAMWYVAKAGALEATNPVLIKQSPGEFNESDCSEINEPDVCRYGDWPGAAPDPLAVTSKSTTGRVWLSNEWNLAPDSQGYSAWRTILTMIGF